MVGFEKAVGAVKVIKDQIQYRSQSLLNLARGYFSSGRSVIIVLIKKIALKNALESNCFLLIRAKTLECGPLNDAN